MARVKGSKDGKVIKARFQGQAKSLFPTLKKTKTLVLLSITANEFCTREYLGAMIETASLSFGFTTFLIADEVYWHNLRTTFCANEERGLKEKAIALGNSFFEDNLEFFWAGLDISKNEIHSIKKHNSVPEKIAALNSIVKDRYNFEIVCWRDWLNKSPVYLEREKDIIQCFNEDPSLKKSVELTSNNFAQRHATEINMHDCLIQRSRGYLTEESAGVIWVAAHLGYNFIAYPGEMIKPFKAAKKYFIQNIVGGDIFIDSDDPQLLVNWLEVIFQRSHENNLYRETNLKKMEIHLDSSLLKSNKSEVSELMIGVTKGIFSLNIDERSKIKLLVDIISEYQTRNKSEIMQNSNNTKDVLFKHATTESFEMS